MPVVGENRSENRRPANTRTRPHMVLHVVGMNIDQAGEKKVTLTIEDDLVTASAGQTRRYCTFVDRNGAFAYCPVGDYKSIREMHATPRQHEQ
ncbi:hypothetical protein CHELA40_14069 [Chelatococcus asaccharovorans]|nr:hypothetical protein CHELA17_61555 [Chelatococcus asaccharovorans]CAH1674951.1 hypothetical protein CHELA40_14069 [Chelatococcus asaccharovorans]